MAKLARKALAHYIDGSFGGEGSPKWYLIGKDIDDMSVELNPDTESTENILGETSVKDNGYEVSMSADPYYADPSDEIYAKIKDTGPFDAWIEDCIVKPQSYGGDTSGVGIPFDVLFNGNRKQGTATISDRVPTFTPSKG